MLIDGAFVLGFFLRSIQVQESLLAQIHLTEICILIAVPLGLFTVQRVLQPKKPFQKSAPKTPHPTKDTTSKSQF